MAALHIGEKPEGAHNVSFRRNQRAIEELSPYGHFLILQVYGYAVTAEEVSADFYTKVIGAHPEGLFRESKNRRPILCNDLNGGSYPPIGVYMDCRDQADAAVIFLVL